MKVRFIKLYLLNYAKNFMIIASPISEDYESEEEEDEEGEGESEYETELSRSDEFKSNSSMSNYPVPGGMRRMGKLS